MSEIMPFIFESHPLRAIERDGDPWFVAADVAAILGYRNAPDMTRKLDDDEAATHLARSSSQNREMTIISESGLYNAIFRSRRPEAQAFRRWVTGTVLPEIRRTGRFVPEPRNEMLDRIAAHVADRPHITLRDLAIAMSVPATAGNLAALGALLRLLGWQRAWVPGPGAGQRPAQLSMGEK